MIEFEKSKCKTRRRRPKCGGVQLVAQELLVRSSGTRSVCAFAILNFDLVPAVRVQDHEVSWTDGGIAAFLPGSVAKLQDESKTGK